MNDKQKKTQKLEKWGRQIGYLAYKIISLSRRDMCQIKGNGLIITVKKWEDTINEHEHFNSKTQENGDKRQVEQRKSTKGSDEETPEESLCQEIKSKTEEPKGIKSDTAFQEQVKKIREGWKK